MTAALVIAMLAADGRVDMPIPKPIVAVATPVTRREPFWTRTTKIEAAAMVGLAAGDMTQTCRFLARGEQERNLTQSCAVNVAITAGFDAAAMTGAWLLNRTGHRKLARVPMAYMAGVSLQGIVASKRNGGW